MVLKTRLVTVEEFERYIWLPENRDRNFEYIGGEIVEVVSNPVSSNLAARITGFLLEERGNTATLVVAD